MARPTRQLEMVKASRAEATLAVRLYNDPTETLAFQAFAVHMHNAWRHLLHAELHRDGTDYRYWLAGRRRLHKVDGQPRLWDLSKCAAHRWPDPQHPVRANLDLWIALRNKVEHDYLRFQHEMVATFGGHAQALLLNYEQELTEQFGEGQSMAHLLRFPVFVGSFTSQGEKTLRELRKRLPAALRQMQAQHESGLTPEVEADGRYELRLRVISELAPRDPEALAIQFTRYDDLSDEAKAAFEVEGRKGFVAVREQARPVVGLHQLKPSEVVQQVRRGAPFPFTMHDHTAAWKRAKVRPAAGDPHPERTLTQFCHYDARLDDYGYTQAWADRLITKCATAEGFAEMTGRSPLPQLGAPADQTVIDLAGLEAGVGAP